ncbi:MAG: 2-hydroxyacyl-CoA dehydratase family protein [Actinobacteria bacterium]|nr:2-hydroxyacyl-CoA dehydratase family protein [Actinomycetota bacterium]MBU1865350.1 2-hydroxyacyl-CoA dehydratase family protein [Actinomycetota bacterium]
MASITLPTRREAIAEARRQGRRIAAVLPYHYPRALLRAHGFHPVEVWGPPGVPRDEGGRHFQSYTCDIVVRATSFLMGGGLDPADVILIPHTCDALQGMGSVVADFLQPSQPVLTLYLPRSDRPSDRRYLVEELRRLSGRLASITGHEATAADWDEAFAAEEAADLALASLYAERSRLAVTDRGFYTAVRSREFLTAEDFVAMAAGLPRGEAPGEGVGLTLSGIVAEPLDLFDRINDAGGRVVSDDLACGARRIYPPSDAADPFERIAGRLIASPPDPTRGSPIEERVRMLADLMRSTGAAGLIVFDVPFCEPELFDVPLLRQHLGEAGYPVLHVEAELGGSLPHQVLTRIEAFVETLR